MDTVVFVNGKETPIKINMILTPECRMIKMIASWGELDIKGKYKHLYATTVNLCHHTIQAAVDILLSGVKKSIKSGYRSAIPIQWNCKTTNVEK